MKRWAGDPRPRGEALVRHGDLVRLEHVSTRRNLHSHNMRALVAPNHYQVNTRAPHSDCQYTSAANPKVSPSIQQYLISPFVQVTGYGEEGAGDDNDVWRLEVEGGAPGQRIETQVSVLYCTVLYCTVLYRAAG